MNDKSHRWYHYFMLRFGMQWAIFVTAAMLALLQMMIYTGIDQDVVVFDEQCQVLVLSSSNSAITEMTCGDEYVELGELTADYLHDLLTRDTVPAIMCVKTVSNYLENVKWACDLEREEL